MGRFSIKFKLVLLFVLIKLLPLFLISYISYLGILKLGEYFDDTTRYISNSSKEIIFNTANEAIEDSVKNLDKKAQESLERLTFEVANNVADFLYQRDEDINLLSNFDMNQDILQKFYDSKNRNIIVHNKFIYNDKTNLWEPETEIPIQGNKNSQANLVDNNNEFNVINPIVLDKKLIPIYKEISYFNINGLEKYKVSKLNTKLTDVSKKKNTYLKAETFFNEIIKLKKDDIYVSEVIGEYVPSKVIGTFTKEKASQEGITFNGKNHAYAGKENPQGKKFQGIIRFIKPYYKNNIKVGYISLALDHEHIMQFTDTINPTAQNPRANIIDASEGNYAFMWDYEGKNISHIRDYFIYGYDKNTGKGVIPWLSKDIADKFYNSKLPINEFLLNYPKFEEQSLKKKPNIKQLKENGKVPLDCRYLNFAPQCDGWMQVTENGGFGSFIIYWSGVWKLTTAASIPYYTGKYADSKRGFGFVTIGANVDEFHAAANKTKNNIKKILATQNEFMNDLIEENQNQVTTYIKNLITELTVITAIITFIVVLIALWLSNYISSKITNLLIATKKFGKNDFNYRTIVTSNDEIGVLEKSFN
ncbi:MAG: sensor histidine kinase, partial [Sulfurovum sp.]